MRPKNRKLIARLTRNANRNTSRVLRDKCLIYVGKSRCVLTCSCGGWHKNEWTTRSCGHLNTLFCGDEAFYTIELTETGKRLFHHRWAEWALRNS